MSAAFDLARRASRTLSLAFTKLVIVTLVAPLAGCGWSEPGNTIEPSEKPTSPPADQVHDDQSLDDRLEPLLERHHIYTLGVGVLRGGSLIWSGFYGEQAPGVPAHSGSLFNTASVSKAVTAETVLRMAEQQQLGLDDPLSEFWVDPDVADDPRHRKLTARLVLSHRTGFPNWRYQADDEKLAFHAVPGESFGYSGEGFEYLRRYVEARFGQPFEFYVEREVFGPLKMKNAAVVSEAFMENRTVVPRSPEDGAPLEPNVNPPGAANAADDFFATVEDYALLLASLHDPFEEAAGLEKLKTTLQSDISRYQEWRCEATDEFVCPTTYGFGLGWLVFEWEGERLIWHGGNDRTEHAIGYIDPKSGDGAIVFANGASGLSAILDALEILDVGPPIASYYRALLARANRG